MDYVLICFIPYEHIGYFQHGAIIIISAAVNILFHLQVRMYNTLAWAYW